MRRRETRPEVWGEYRLNAYDRGSGRSVFCDYVRQRAIESLEAHPAYTAVMLAIQAQGHEIGYVGVYGPDFHRIILVDYDAHSANPEVCIGGQVCRVR